MTDISELLDLLNPHGLILRGALNESEIEEDFPGDREMRTRQLILVGNAGSDIWRPFTASDEHGDGLPDPMDRWTRRIGEDLARQLGGRAIFPWEGPPYPPFLDWSRKTGQVFPSPVSMFVHRDYGLWHAYRFALALPRPLTGFEPARDEISPCLGCPEPCLEACPVGAFSHGGYQVEKCADYLRKDEHSTCRAQGCEARRACPFGSSFGYEQDHARFHMTAFLESRPIF